MDMEYSANDLCTSTNNEDHQVNKCIPETSPKVSSPELSNNDKVNNHSSNSNDSHPDSMNNVQDNSEKTGQVDPEQKVEKDIDDDRKSHVTAAVDTRNEESEEFDGDDSSDEEGSVGSDGPRADTVSINSGSEPDGGDETSQESQPENKDSAIIITENERPDSQNGNCLVSSSPEIHEIPSDNDDCISVNDDKSNTSISEVKILRRSSRATKRKCYEDMENGDCESDIEEVEMEDPLSCKTKPIIINDTKALAQITRKQLKYSHYNQKKEPTVVIIDTNSKKESTTHIKNTTTNSSTNLQSLLPSILVSGTTVTPVSSKPSSSTQSPPQNTQPSILPSLTDDMFVVEAPSFIVPYVYEKPSIKAFREFVDKLGKELEEQRAKEEQQLLEKEKVEKEKREKEKMSKRERGEEVEESEEEKDKTDENEAEKKKKKSDKRERKKRRNDDDDASWDGETSTDSEEEILSDDDTVVIKDKASSIENIKDVTDLTADKVCSGKSDSYFDCSLGNFFVNIGLNMVQEYVQNDLLKQQNRKLYREKKSGHSTKATQISIASLMKNLEFSKENNAPYTFTQKKCELCSFKTDSSLVMNQHLETPHMKNNIYKCNFCPFEIRSPHDILYHMEAEHNVRGKLDRAPACHQCPNCPFEDNGKGKLGRHQIACAKKFRPELNLAPPIEWEPPAKIPKITRARNNMVNSYQNVFNRQVANSMNRPTALSNLMSGSGYSPRVPVPSRSVSVHGVPLPSGGYRPRATATPRSHVPILRGGGMLRNNTASTTYTGSNYTVANNGKSKSMHQPSISITPLPRQPQPIQQPAHQSKSTFVICEICDGYIKDLEQLRNHMQWIHKVKIHPKMIYNRPPLNCQKCQFRFFTDQGLERHLLGSHGLVTSSMQEAANKGKDAGRCPVCGRVYQWKLLNHVSKDHNLTLKPAHLSYKCTVCTATFGMYKQFENHVYSAHSVVAKRVMDKSKTSTAPAKSTNDSLLMPLKINDEITIIPQPVKPATSKDK